MISEIVKELREGSITNRKQLIALKRRHPVNGRIVKNSDVLEQLTDEEKQKFAQLLLRKPVRSNSGVLNITVMTKQGPCPHGICYFCPIVPGVPFSYTGNEPASMRGKMRGWDPYLQIFDRLRQYYAIGHQPSKIEVVVNGGTFLNHEVNYKEWFIRRIYQALNDYPVSREDSNSLEDAKKINETAKHRLIALVLETRPDSFDVDEVLRFGCTRIEFGVQNLDDNILKSVNRGHGVREVIEATRIAKNAGLKVDFHMMVGLPGATIDSDIQMFKELFSNEEFCPDGLKIYPTLLMKQAVLYKWAQNGDYEPINDDYVFNVLKIVKPSIPRYVRIKRIMRDIPLTVTVGKLKKGNIRELLWKEVKCNCIRCREVGHKKLVSEPVIELHVNEYNASGGREIFISFDDAKSDALIGFLRLRLCESGAFVRELHVYGNQLVVGAQGLDFQHKGFGKRLLAEAELIAMKNNFKELKVISGVGVREYYNKLGYFFDGIYMSRQL